jgi:long-chain fatty acid transport protein
MNASAMPAATRRFLRLPSLAVAACLLPAYPHGARASEGLYGTGGGARAMAMGGADVASPDSSLAAMAGNPAGLSLLNSSEADAGLMGASAYGRFDSRTGEGGLLSTALVTAPEGALAIPIRSTPVTVGFGIVPQIGLAAHWNYPDPPGGLNGATSYGQQADNSTIEEIRVAIGVSVAITSRLSIGGSFGLNYDQNLLETPYIFQSQPALRGFKTLLDMSSRGFGVDGGGGILYRPFDTLSIGLSYQSRTTIKTYGDAAGNAEAQLDALGPAFAGVGRDFHYSAEVDDTFPQVVSGGIAWKFLPGWEASTEIDWTNWSDAFDTLPIKLTNGSNRQINALVGSNSIQDNILLHWKDRFTYRIGIERAITPSIFLRAGYSYCESPVPSDTLTPLTAAIPESTLSAGAGYRWRSLEVDLAYQWDIAATRHVGTSALLDGEYSGSTVSAGIQWLGLTTFMGF